MKVFDPLVGEWALELTHPSLPGTVVSGTATFEWLEGEQFLIQRSRADHPDFPDSIGIVGPAELYYFDSRGVHRVYGVSMSDGTLKLWRDEPGFGQRFTGTLSDDGSTLPGLWQLCLDGSTWNDDLEITYRR